MRAMSAMVFLAVCVLLALAYQGVRQELSIQELKARIARAMLEVKSKEDDIVSSKQKLLDLNSEMNPLNVKKGTLTKTRDGLKAEAVSSKALFEKCINDKKEAEIKSTQAAQDLQRKKKEQETETKEAMAEIQALKQKILDRNKEVCEFVDTAQEQGRKLCGISS